MERGASPHAHPPVASHSLSAFVDTSILVRHFTGDPPEQARGASSFLAKAEELLLTDLVAAEVVYVLESFYEVPRARVAELVRAILAFESTVLVDLSLLLRALELYEVNELDFADAYLVASAETSGVNTVASFDRSIDRVGTCDHRLRRQATLCLGRSW
jgi:predicted nucleic acid-binding protein